MGVIVDITDNRTEYPYNYSLQEFTICGKADSRVDIMGCQFNSIYGPSIYDLAIINLIAPLPKSSKVDPISVARRLIREKIGPTDKNNCPAYLLIPNHPELFLPEVLHVMTAVADDFNKLKFRNLQNAPMSVYTGDYLPGQPAVAISSEPSLVMKETNFLHASIYRYIQQVNNVLDPSWKTKPLPEEFFNHLY